MCKRIANVVIKLIILFLFYNKKPGEKKKTQHSNRSMRDKPVLTCSSGDIKNYTEKRNSINKQKQKKKNILTSTELKANEPSFMQMSTNLVHTVRFQNVFHQKQEQ